MPAPSDPAGPANPSICTPASKPSSPSNSPSLTIAKINKRPKRRWLLIASKTDNTRLERTTPRPGRTTRQTTPDWQIDHRQTTSEALDEQLHGPEALGVPDVQLA